MWSWWRQLFSADFLPHGYCLQWSPDLIWLHVGSDIAITVAYYAIPAVLLTLVRRRKDIPYPSLIYLFAAFIFACGTTHLLGAWTVWSAVYRIEAVVKAVTGIVSLATAAYLVPLLPRILDLKSPDELAETNRELQRQIRERTRVEAELRESEMRFREISEHIEEIFWMYSVASGKMLYVNSSYDRVFGRPRKALLDDPDDWLQAIHPEDRPRIRRRVKERQAAEGFDDEYRVVLPGGEIRWIHNRGYPIFNEQGTVDRLVGVAEDVTRRKLFEEALQKAHDELEQRVRQRTMELEEANERLRQEVAVRKRVAEQRRRDLEALAETKRISERQATELRHQKEALEASNAELAQFAYAASHDLKEPLRMVSSYSQLLLNRYGERLEGEAAEFLRYIVNGAARMRGMIDGLLEYSRLGRATMWFSSVELSDCIQDALANLKVASEECGGKVRFEDLPKVFADKGQLTRLFQNLISNALKYRRGETATVEINAKEAEDEWVIAVADDGIGIEPQFVDRIFGVFQRLHPADEYPGTGIGLALCKKIVERHGGRIWVEPNDPPGATICFTLPR